MDTQTVFQSGVKLLMQLPSIISESAETGSFIYDENKNEIEVQINKLKTYEEELIKCHLT